MLDYEYLTDNKEELISDLISAIKTFGENPGALENLESYLSCHFVEWCDKWGKTPEGFISELKHFSEIQ